MNLQPNTLFHDRYRLIEMKGRGSFGEVWLARDENLDLDVAIKVYIALDDRGVAEFKSEYKTTFGLNHPNLLHANHFDLCEKRPYLVMPYCPSSATDYIGNIDEPTLWRFLHDVSSGLEYLHSMEIVHHDIKPDNILIDTEGNFLITDFGISKKMRSTLRRNSMRQVEEQVAGGSVSYMGPEMFTKQPESVKATDIWALGATLFEMCEGELPFFGQGGGMQLNGADIPELHGNYSDDFKQIIRMCLSKDTWDRPQAAQLREYAQIKMGGGSLPGLKEAVVEKKKNKKGVWIAVVSVIALISVISVAAVVLGWFAPPRETPEQQFARENITVYEQRVKECQTSINAGEYENGQYVKLLQAQDELKEIKRLEDEGQQYYPDTYNRFEPMKRQLEDKMQMVGKRYADHALGFINLDPEQALQEFDIAKKLYPGYTSPEYESFINQFKDNEY